MEQYDLIEVLYDNYRDDESRPNSPDLIDAWEAFDNAIRFLSFDLKDSIGSKAAEVASEAMRQGYHEGFIAAVALLGGGSRKEA